MTISLEGKKAIVLGLGTSGVSATKFLYHRGAKVTVSDIRKESELTTQLAAVGGCFQQAILGQNNPEQFDQYDLIITSPGVRNPKTLRALKPHADRVFTEAELGLMFYPHRIVAITGTNGKTTTGLLLQNILSQLSTPSFFGGNNGYPVCEYLETRGKKAETLCIVELSSFMLQWFRRVTPTVGIVLNVSSHHTVDHEESFENYILAKQNIAHRIHTSGTLILNALDPHMQRFKNATKARLAYFSKHSLQKVLQDNPTLRVIHLSAPRTVTIHTGQTSPVYELNLKSFPLIGLHNIDNVMAALLSSLVLEPAKFDEQYRQLDFSQLKSPKYRLQLVFEREKIKIFNDAKSSNVMSVINALNALPGPIHLICGGKETHEDFSRLVPFVKKKVKTLLLVGQTKERLNRVLGDTVDTFLLGSIEEALLLAHQKSRGGDQILFSPGFPSFDKFKNFEERGRCFDECISHL